jgi:hypothetical protein
MPVSAWVVAHRSQVFHNKIFFLVTNNLDPQNTKRTLTTCAKELLTARPNYSVSAVQNPPLSRLSARFYV